MKPLLAALALSLTTAASAGEYQSAIADYAPYRDGPLADWRAVNDEVGRLGGHGGHLMEGATVGHDAHAGHGTPAQPPAPAAGGHIHQHHHGGNGQ